jgi:hypothetical protein
MHKAIGWQNWLVAMGNMCGIIHPGKTGLGLKQKLAETVGLANYWIVKNAI